MKGLNEIFDRADAGILLIDNQHRIRWMNRRAMEWLGPLELGKKRVCYRTLEYSDKFCTICPTGETIEHGTPTRYELTVHPRGRRCILEITGIPILDKDGSVSMVIEVIVDVTEKKMELRKTYDLMAQIEKMAAIGQLAAGVAHELNTPMATISVISEELRTILNPETTSEGLTRDEVRDYLEDMEGEITRCKRIIDDLLDFSKKGAFHLVETDINALVMETMGFMYDKGGIPKKIGISTDLNAQLLRVKTDPLRLRQVIFNILKNAVEAINDSPDGRIAISTGFESKYIKIVISDNGPGIPVKDQPKVFEPFFTTKPLGKGTGLGLFVSYGIMKELNGDIDIRSVPGKGTEVHLFIPHE